MEVFVEIGTFVFGQIVNLLNSFEILGLGFTPWQLFMLGFTVVIIRYFYGLFNK